MSDDIRPPTREAIRAAFTSTHLHCSFCGEAHRFTRGEVEQIVYVLLGTVSDLIDHDDHREWAKAARDTPYQTYDHLVCLREVCQSATDIEQWSEWVESLVECRRSSVRHQPIPTEGDPDV